MSKEFKFTMGADPEFNMEMNNKRLNASNAISLLLENHKKFKKERDGFVLRDKKVGNIGWDGCASTGEIRPTPSKKPEEIVSNLKELFTEFHKVAPLFELSTLSRSAPIGGHIHFEVKVERGNVSRQKMSNLHKRIASFYLPILMGENKVNLMVRMKGNYGGLCGDNHSSAYRVENKFTYPNGEPGFTYELRCPSAEWMTTPKVANATMAYLGVVFNEITNNPRNFEKVCKDIIIRTDQQGEALQTMAMAEYKPLTMSLFGKIQKYIREFELYPEFKEEIDYILNPKKVLADKQAANYDIRSGWGLKESNKEATKRRIISDKAFKIEAKKKDLDVMGQFVKISYNDDMNVEIFAKAITKRSVAFNWNLQKTYYFFGIRKGIKDYVIVDAKGSIIQGFEQCKTIMDKEAMTELIQKVRSKASNALGGGFETKKINFSTGKVEKIRNEIVLVGIPYETRLKEPNKEFIELIYNIEKDNIKPFQNKEQLIDDVDLPEEEKGNVYKVLNGVEAQNLELATATEESIRSTQRDAMNAVIQDLETAERDEIVMNMPEDNVLRFVDAIAHTRPTPVFSVDTSEDFNDEDEDN